MFLTPNLFTQNYADVSANYRDTAYMDTLNGRKIQFPQQFLDSIKKFDVKSYRQSFPSSGVSALRSWIIFTCPIEKAEELATYLQTYETSLFTEIHYYMPPSTQSPKFEFNPIDYYWNKSRVIYPPLYNYVPDTLDYLWHLKKIQADLAWDITRGDSSIKIAILDCGYNVLHPDIFPKLNFLDPYEEELFDWNDPNNTQEHFKTIILHDTTIDQHGTKVTCTAAGNTNEPNGWTASVGFNSGLVGYLIDPNRVDNYINKASHAARTKKVNVINISFKGVESNVYMHPRWIAAIKEILDSNVVIVRSAGNDPSIPGTDRYPFSPLIDDRIIVVSSTNHLDKHEDPTSFPSDTVWTDAHYPEVTICAPGYYITAATSVIDGSPPYDEKVSGTSVATAIVSGVCALMKSINPDLTVPEVKRIIQATTDPILDEHLYSGQLGAGRINAYKAVKAVNDCYTEPVLKDTIISNVTCSIPMRTSKPIIIQNGGVLTINSTLKCSEDVYIKVMPGGKLIVNGGILQNGCIENSWQGIIVEGNSTQSQMGANANQGIVVFNGATIENAICGIKVGDLSDPSKSGGIVYATNSTFKNCMNSVIFRPYENMNGNIEFANRSKFTNCNFVIDTNFNSTGLVFDTHVKLFGVNGISFTGCSFTDTQTNPNPPINQYSSSGIFAKNSGFSVQPKCFSNVASGEVCASPYVDVPSIFSGLRYGIVILNSGTMKQVKISSTQFTNNDCGVFVSGLHNVKLLNNDFVIGKNNSSLISYPVGADFEYASNFRIEENRFLKNSTFLGSAYGLKIKASGVDNNMVYKNKFIDLDNAQIFVGHNYYQPNPFNGLKSICNEHTNNTFDDIMVTIDPNSVVNGINMYQNMEYIVNGVSQTVAAGNIFTLPNSINMQYINNANYLFYYFNPNNSNEVLTNYTTATIGTVTAPENPCPSKIFGLYPQIIDAELASITLDYANLRYNYNQLIDAGNTPEMLQLIQGEWSDDVWKLRNELIAKSPYLSQDVLLTVAMENLLPPALLLEVCLANPDATKSEEFLDKLRYEIPNPLPEYMINLIKSSWDEKTLRTEMEEELSAFKTYRDEYHNYKTELLLSDTVYNYTNIINHLESRGSYSDYFSLAEIAISQNNFTQADIYLDILENSTEKFTEEEILEIASFREYISIRESIALNNKTIYNLDSAQIATLEIYAYSNNYRGAVLARNILCALYDICIDDIPAPPRSLRVGSNEGNNHNNIPFIASVKVMPNPASEYAAFIWDMKSFDKSSVLYIYDQNGKIIVTQPIHTQQGEWVWNVKNIPDGVYVYTFKSDQLVLFSGKLMINK